MSLSRNFLSLSLSLSRRRNFTRVSPSRNFMSLSLSLSPNRRRKCRSPSRRRNFT